MIELNKIYNGEIAKKRIENELKQQHYFDMKKIIVLKDEKKGKKIAFVRQSDTMILVLRILAALNIGACVFSTIRQLYLVALLDLVVSFFTYAISSNVERNNEIFDFFDNSENNLNQ